MISLMYIQTVRYNITKNNIKNNVLLNLLNNTNILLLYASICIHICRLTFLIILFTAKNNYKNVDRYIYIYMSYNQQKVQLCWLQGKLVCLCVAQYRIRRLFFGGNYSNKEINARTQIKREVIISDGNKANRQQKDEKELGNIYWTLTIENS